VNIVWIESYDANPNNSIWYRSFWPWVVFLPQCKHYIFLITGFVIQHYAIPQGVIAVEREIQAYGMRKRFDIVVIANNASPLILIECKAPEVKITRNTLIQAATYNNKLDSRFVWITNGLEHAWFEKVNGNLQLINPPDPAVFTQREQQ